MKHWTLLAIGLVSIGLYISFCSTRDWTQDYIHAVRYLPWSYIPGPQLWFSEMGSCDPDWPQTWSVHQGWPWTPAFASQVVELQVCAIIPSNFFLLTKNYVFLMYTACSYVCVYVKSVNYNFLKIVPICIFFSFQKMLSSTKYT